MTRSCAYALVALLTPQAALAQPAGEPEGEPTLAPDESKKLASTAVDPRKDEARTDGRRYLLAAGEFVAQLGLGAAWYWSDLELQRPDWVLGWDRESWVMKLTSFDAVRFDTNPIHVNAFGHTGQAVLAYHAGRGNGLGFTGATLMNVASTFVWEYIVEFREYVSLNDLIVNSVSGPALAEPLWQIGDYFRSGKKTWYNEGLAAFFQPFDEIERRVNGRAWRESARPWHRFEVSAGTSVQSERTDASVAVDLEVASFDRSGARDGWTPAGGWSRISGELRFGDGVGGGRFHSRTSYAGYQSRAIADDGIGRSAFVGFGTGITYENSQVAIAGDQGSLTTRDQLAVYHLIGPQADLHLRTTNVDVRWQAAAYGNLAMVNAHAMVGMPPIDPEPPWESPLTRPGGYYFGVGATAWTRLLVGWGRWRTDLEAHAHQVFSLDKKNADRGEPDPPKDVADGRIYGRVKLGYALLPGRLALDGTVDLAGRRGTVGQMERSSGEQRWGVQLTLLH